jgi:hypothetical protein
MTPRWTESTPNTRRIRKTRANGPIIYPPQAD